MSHPTISPTTYHLIPRFVAGEWFVKSDVERNAYLHLLADALKTSDWRCIAYAVMSNHIHLGVVAGARPRAEWLRNTHAPFGAWINDRSDRFGAVFAHGMKSRVVAPNEIGQVIAYIHNNPVRAGVVRAASESSWTSHRHYLGLSPKPAWLDVDLGLALMKLDGADAFDRMVEFEAPRARQERRRRGRPSVRDEK